MVVGGSKLSAWVQRKLHLINPPLQPEEDPPPLPSSLSPPPAHRLGQKDIIDNSNNSKPPSRKKKIREARRAYRYGYYKRQVYPSTYDDLNNPIVYSGHQE